MTCTCETSAPIQHRKPDSILPPRRLTFSWFDYLLAFAEWINAFGSARAIAPGLYFTGTAPDPSVPVLVTCNYHLTVFLLWRTLRGRNVRVLVIDTRGINVWCSAGKGQFSSAEILRQVDRCDRADLSFDGQVRLVLPKLSLSGVKLSELRAAGVQPVIGPIYRHALPRYLDERTFPDRRQDKYRFDLRDRLFILVPSVVQFSIYMAVLSVLLWGWNLLYPSFPAWTPLAYGLGLSIPYILLFPALPSRQFAIKGLVTSALALAALSGWWLLRGTWEAWTFAFGAVLLASLGLWFGLYFTGNSGVSNYTLVKREIVRWLPAAALGLAGSLMLAVVKGGLR